jgi:integrase/recombinase XerD
MTTPTPRPRERKPLDAGAFEPEIRSFRLHLAAEAKAARTVRTYTDAVRWFAADYLITGTGYGSWEEVCGWDVQRWLVWLLSRYSDAYASNQYRALRQFFRWWADEEDHPDRWRGCVLRRSRSSSCQCSAAGELSKLEGACQGRGFAQRRDHAIISVFRATGIRLSEMAGIRYDPDDPRRSDFDLMRREIVVRGKGGRSRIVRISHQAARSLDRYLRVRARHEQAHRPQLWLGVNSRGLMTANGTCQMVARRGRQCGVRVHPHRFRHHFSHTWLDRGGAEGDLMELNGWASPQMLLRYGASARSARARRTYDRIMEGSM